MINTNDINKLQETVAAIDNSINSLIAADKQFASDITKLSTTDAGYV